MRARANEIEASEPALGSGCEPTAYSIRLLTMSMMRSVVGLNKSLASQSVTRMLATGARGFHAGTSFSVWHELY